MEALGGERRCSFYSFTISSLDGREWSASRPGRALSPGKGPRYPLDRRLGAPHSRSVQRLEEKSFASAGDRTSFARLAVISIDFNLLYAAMLYF
jgi:hypothetical protein